MAADFTGTGFTGKDFTGKVSVDIRDSTPDWAPFAEPRAPEGAPNVLYLVWDDTGIGTGTCTAVWSRCPTSGASRIAVCC